MKRCFACGQRIALGDEMGIMFLGDEARARLGLPDSRKNLFFHDKCYQEWLKGYWERRSELRHSLKGFPAGESRSF